MITFNDNVTFQITRLGSPNLDISYFLHTSVKPNVRREAFQELMHHYFNTLTETLEKLGSSCPWSYDEFMVDYSERGQLGYFMNMVIAGAVGALKDMDPETMSSNPEEMMNQWNSTIDNWIARNPEKAAEIAKEIVAFVKENQEVVEMGRELKAALKYRNGEVLQGPLREKFVEIIRKQGITEEVGEIMMVEPQELKGEHMATASVYVQVEFKGGVRKPKNLFVKKPYNNSGHTEMTKQMRIMEKEGKFLHDFLPKMREFCGQISGYLINIICDII